MCRINYNTPTKFPANLDRNTTVNITRNIELEKKSVLKLLYKNFPKKEKWLNYFETATLSKMTQLSTARKFKINIPPTIITTRKSDLINFKKIHKKIIIKPIETYGSIFIDNDSLTPLTALIDDEFIDGLEDTFFPILSQKYIDKKYEIRTFYLDNSFYSMAIFTQKNEASKIDSRNNIQEKLRSVPYKLSKNIEKKLRKFPKNLRISIRRLQTNT